MTEEEKTAIAAMRAASSRFYAAATATGVHAFIEFTGLMNEYIQICEKNPGFMHANTHSEQPMAMADHEAAYLAEKLDCIYGPSLRASQQLARALIPEPYRGEPCPGPRCHGVISIAHGKCTACNINYLGALPANPAYDELRKY